MKNFRSTHCRLACESLEGRQLMATAAESTTLAVFSPPATAVSNAAEILNAANPRVFARFERALSAAERHSHLSESDAGILAQDESQIDLAIRSSSLTADNAQSTVNYVQDVIDFALVDNRRELAQSRAALDQYLSNVSAALPLVAPTISQMEIVAKMAHISPSLRNALEVDDRILTGDLGSNINTDLGPGATDRDPFAVYYDGQAVNFVKD
jgi:hypothetical protein